MGASLDGTMSPAEQDLRPTRAYHNRWTKLRGNPMTERPIPERPNSILWARFVDPKIIEQSQHIMEASLEDFEMFLWEQKKAFRVISKPVVGETPCYLLRDRDGKKLPRKDYTSRVRAMVALHIGIVPAQFCDFIPGYYDKDFLRTYRYSIITKCKFGSDYCVRPSHLIPCTYLGQSLRYEEE